MKLFIANLTKQNNHFIYRLPESNRPIDVFIRPGQQMALPGDLSKIEVDSIVNQHLAYGLKTVSEVLKHPGYVGLVYSIDKPVNVDAIENGIQTRDDLLDEQAAEVRKTSAASVNQYLEEQLQQPIEVEVSTALEVARGETPVESIAVKRGRPSKHA